MCDCVRALLLTRYHHVDSKLAHSVVTTTTLGRAVLPTLSSKSIERLIKDMIASIPKHNAASSAPYSIQFTG
jgi:hypothetical protein